MNGRLRARSRVTPTGALWMTLTQALSVAVGLGCAFLILGAVSVSFLVCMGAIGLLVVCLTRIPGNRSVRVETGLMPAVVAMSWIGMVLAFGILGAVWGCALVYSVVPVRRWRPRLSRRLDRWSVSTPLADAVPASVPIGRMTRNLPDLDLDRLCVMWHRSYFQLLDAARTPDSSVVVEYRQRILDEIYRRDPRGVSRWLASGPRASASPLTFLRSAASPPDENEGAGGHPTEPQRDNGEGPDDPGGVFAGL